MLKLKIMIPKNIIRNHILNAIQKVDLNGIPKGRDSKKFKLVYKAKIYPPKYLISIANQLANGEELESSGFSGGRETNNYLEWLGFEITGKSPLSKQLLKSPKINKSRSQSIKSHYERCPDCKQTIEKMLRKIYGEVICNYKFELGVLPEDFIKSEHYHELKDIFSSLKRYRGHDSFTRTHELPSVDFYVPNPGIIVEFDESQHFTSCRKVALIKYPASLRIGFDVNKWIELCDKINAKDNDPLFRDEQRAWYDTLRDFLPSIKQLKPTIRLYSKDFHWCSLNPKVKSDVNKFEILMERKKTQSDIEVKEDINPSLARIVIDGDWEGNINTSKKILHKICDKWPHGKKVNCLITCGAFLNFDWPQSITDVGNDKYPNEKALDSLKSKAEKYCKFLIDEELRKKLNRYADYITIGIDSYKDKISLSNVSIRQLHVELVALLDLKTNKYSWTGKSYPTTGQENRLVRFQDLKTHFVELPFGKVLILGCHDLNVFSPRGKVTTKNEWRKQIRKGFYNIVKKETPTIVLHHPHTTDSSRIWTGAWNELMKVAPTIKEYISAGRYFNSNGERSDINDVLRKTKFGDTIDFIVNSEI
jgi:hypothetical protein